LSSIKTHHGFAKAKIGNKEMQWSASSKTGGKVLKTDILDATRGGQLGSSLDRQDIAHARKGSRLQEYRCTSSSGLICH
jgi:hypothetical protein